ncbi:MAG: hypothetical protein ACPHWZ_12305, partial [Longimicrobiales bacterium]
MKIRSMILLSALLAMAAPVEAQQRRQMTPEERAARETARREAMAEPRPIEAMESLWIEELTWMELRDA